MSVGVGFPAGVVTASGVDAGDGVGEFVYRERREEAGGRGGRGQRGEGKQEREGRTESSESRVVLLETVLETGGVEGDSDDLKKEFFDQEDERRSEEGLRAWMKTSQIARGRRVD